MNTLRDRRLKMKMEVDEVPKGENAVLEIKISSTKINSRLDTTEKISMKLKTQ
jgi:hypothetical protein